MALALGEKVPDFTANTSKGPISFSSYKGKWVLLFSHPADFTPVCTTEFMAFSSRYEDFKKLGVELLGVSIDSVYSHIAWVRDIKEKYGVDIPFPIIADVNKEIATIFNIINPEDGLTIRGVFVIDPNQRVRWIAYYPAEVGRSMDELIRVLTAFQFNWNKKLATPANWKEGDGGVMGAPTTVDASYQREKEGAERWYLKKVKP